MLPGTPRTFVGSTTFTVTGMTCRRCVRIVHEAIGAVPGVEEVGVDPASGIITVSAARPVDRADVEAAVVAAGYGVVP